MTEFRFWGLALAATSLLACSGTTEVPDAGPPPMDAEVVVDSGMRAECPVAANSPDCMSASDCGNAGSPAPNCDYCRARYSDICVFGRCETPAELSGAEGFFMRFNISGFENIVDSFAGFAVAAETTGGNPLTCDDIFAAGKSFDWDNPCINLIDSRYTERSGQPAQAFPMRFGRFQENTPALLVVYGFTDTMAEGDPVGVACKAVPGRAVGETDGDIEVDGDMMRSIQ